MEAALRVEVSKKNHPEEWVTLNGGFVRESAPKWPQFRLRIFNKLPRFIGKMPFRFHVNLPHLKCRTCKSFLLVWIRFAAIFHEFSVKNPMETGSFSFPLSNGARKHRPIFSKMDLLL